jgi:hypothetical protein
MADERQPIWVLDSSSSIAIRTLIPRDKREALYNRLTELVKAGRLKFPREVVGELRKYAGPENPALAWANAQSDVAARDQPTLAEVREVLGQVPEVLDPDKEGEEEGDPYILAMARRLEGDIRIVTEDVKSTGSKMSLAGAAGYLGNPKRTSARS